MLVILKVLIASFAFFNIYHFCIFKDLKIMKVGQGAYGDVWLAEDCEAKKRVALKKCKLADEREGVYVMGHMYIFYNL